MKLLKILFTLLISTSTSILAQVPTTQWAAVFADTTSENSQEGNSLDIDNSGNVYTMGLFHGYGDFDPGPSTLLLTSAGGKDFFITKQDPLGNLICAKKLGGPNNEIGGRLILDGQGNIYVTGNFSGSIDFDLGPNSYILNGGQCFVAKYDTAFNFIWARNFGGPYARAFDISVDQNGNVYTAGIYTNSGDFDPGIGIHNLTTQGGNDAFVSKLDANGNFGWAKSIGSTGYDDIQTIRVSASGHIYLGGNFHQTIDFDPGPLTYSLTSNGLRDLFIAKWDTAANFIWAKRLGGADANGLNTMDIESTENIVFSGQFHDSIDADPNAGIYMLQATGPIAYIFGKLDSAGNFIRAGEISGANTRHITVDNNDNLYVSGIFRNTIDVDMGPGVFNLTTASTNNKFYHAKYDAQGNLLWGQNFYSPGNGSCYPTTMRIDDNFRIYTTGSFFDSVDFDPGPGTIWYANNYSPPYASADCFVLKMSQCSNTTDSINASACDSYLSPSGNYLWTNSGTYTDLIPNAANCDSILTINLTILSVDTSVTQSTNGLSSNAISATYQWVDCGNNYSILANQTNQSFTPQMTGNYAVIVTQNGCTDTSSCYAFNEEPNGVYNGENDQRFNVYPNPSNGMLYVTAEISDINILIYSVEGKEVFSQQLHSGLNSLNVSSLANGIYLYQFSSNSEVIQNGKLLVE